MMERNIGQVPIKHAIRSKLISMGYERIDSFEMEDWEHLSKDLGIPEEEARHLLEKICRYNRDSLPDVNKPTTALDLWEKCQLTSQCIVTGSRHLNGILDGGIPLGGIVEVCGVPGIGKTQLCMQLCVNVQLPTEMKGPHGSAIYIDTDGGFVVERLHEIAKALVDQCEKESTQPYNSPDIRAALERVNIEDTLRNIYHFRCHDYFDLIAVIHLLREFIQQKKNIKLIVIDSIASPFRYAFEDMARRAKILNGLMQKLTAIAIDNKIAVVITNQMTTRIVPGEESRLIPALGISWGYSCAIRLNLVWKDDNTRSAILFKSPSSGETSAMFAVVAAGIRDHISVEVPELVQDTDGQISHSQLMSAFLEDDNDSKIDEDK